MHRRTFLAGIAAALATYAVPGMQPGSRVLVFTTARATSWRPTAIVTGLDQHGRARTEEIEVAGYDEGEWSIVISRDMDTIQTITWPARMSTDGKIEITVTA